MWGHVGFFSLFLVDRAHWFRRVVKKNKQIVDHVNLHCTSPCTQWSVIIVWETDLRLHMLAKWISFHCEESLLLRALWIARNSFAVASWVSRFCWLLGTWTAMGCDAVFFFLCLFFPFALPYWLRNKEKKPHGLTDCSCRNFKRVKIS